MIYSSTNIFPTRRDIFHILFRNEFFPSSSGLCRCAVCGERRLKTCCYVATPITDVSPLEELGLAVQRQQQQDWRWIIHETSELVLQGNDSSLELEVFSIFSLQSDNKSPANSPTASQETFLQFSASLGDKFSSETRSINKLISSTSEWLLRARFDYAF